MRKLALELSQTQVILICRAPQSRPLERPNRLGFRVAENLEPGNVDIKDFFPSISSRAVYALFIEMGCSPDVSRILVRLLTVDGHISQGGRASTTVANLVLWRLDVTLVEMQTQGELSASRIVDDITVSSGRVEVRRAVETVIGLIHRQGFGAKRSKIRISAAGERQEVAGLTLNSGPKVPKSYRSRVRAQVRRARRYGIDEKGRASLLGRIAYVERTNPEAAMRLRDELELALFIVRKQTRLLGDARY